ncbi:amidohydrolase [Clostridium sp. MCC353]|uniref:amidohydrolase n=1 Tax=Clostridium sp. MCC353 TaxID=2592646 RepID=UPI001C024339|nr:amidohydrolase [Clostridium sp. MCC353]MBT9779227.1 amidohydrolase [Clostridium sp. MCC353]
MNSKEVICDAVKRKADMIAGINQAVWDYAEFGYQEVKSAEKIVQVLEEEGFQVETGIAGIETAFVGSYGSGKPVIAVLAEYDALPDLSQKAGCAVKSPVPGKTYGHGCGHSALGAGAVGAAIAAKEYLKANHAAGTVKLFGCPAEEMGFGKAFMVREGCFDGVDLAFTWHPSDCNGISAYKSVAYYKVRFRFKGVTAHAGGAPHLGRSALDACELMNVGVNYLREHIITDARVHYAYLDCGGDAPNIVQDHAALLYFVRAPKLIQCGEILERIKKIAQGAALMTETEVEIKVLGGLSDTVPNEEASKVLSEAYCEVGGPEFSEKEFAVARDFLAILTEQDKKRILKAGAEAVGITEEEFAERPLYTNVIPFRPEMMNTLATISTDVGDVSYQVPTGQISAAIGIPGTGLHTWQATAQVGSSIGDQASLAVARVIGLACAKVFEHPEVVERAKEELKKATGGEYLSPIQEGAKPGDED